MKMIVTKITKETVKKADSEFFGKPYFILEGYAGPMHSMVDVKLLVSAPRSASATEVMEKYYDAQIASQKFDSVDIAIVVVGDTSTGGTPLPLYQSVRRDGALSTSIRSTMRVTVKCDEQGRPLEDAQQKALRIINTPELCRIVVPTTGNHTDTVVETAPAPPPVAAPAAPAPPAP